MSSSNNGDVNPEKWPAIFEEFQKDYKDAYYNVDKAIKLDEEGNLTEALPLYEFGLNLIDKALDLLITEPTKADLSWEKAVAMTQKLRKTRKEIQIRIDHFKSKPQPEAMEHPPSYEEAIESSKSHFAGTSNNANGNCNNNIQLPGPSKTDVPYFPPSALQDENLLANLHGNGKVSSNASVTYSDLSQQLKEMKLAKNGEILFQCDNVQMCFIAPDGRVSSGPQPSVMIIARVYDATSKILNEALNNIVNDLYREIHETKKKRHKHSLLHKKHHHRHKNKKYKRKKDEASDPVNQTFLQVDSWIYPLIPKVSFCLRSASGAFILPDINSNTNGACVGLILPEDVQDEVHELFTELLNKEVPEERRRRATADFTPDANSSKFIRGTAYLAHYLVKGASTAAQFFDSSTPKIINLINPQPEPVPINPAIQKTFEVAKTVTDKAVTVTDYLVTKVHSATLALGRYLSPYVEKQSKELLALTINTSEEEALKKIRSAMNVTSNTLEGVYTIYDGLETASSILRRSLANNTVQIIEYKYGQAAGAVTNDAIATLTNVMHTRRNLKPRKVAKSTLKETGHALLNDYKIPHSEFRGAGPGSGSGISPST